MAKSLIGRLAGSLLTILLIVPANQADAGTVVTVTFSGTVSGTGAAFSGSFAYDESQPAASIYEFKFEGATFTHMAVYTTAPTGRKTGLDSTCEPFTILTSGNTFTVVGTVPQSPATTVTIVLPVSVTLSATSLPLCTTGNPPVATFPSPPLSGSTFTLSGGTALTGTITSVSCSQTAGAIVRFSASVDASPGPSPASSYGSPYPAPVYACQPRPRCCLSQFFARLSHRNCCW
jgi:hypothetical protein